MSAYAQEIPAAACARIAIDVEERTGVPIDTDDVEQIILTHDDPPRNEPPARWLLRKAVLEEARKYDGLVPA